MQNYSSYMHHNAYTVTAFIVLITSASSKANCWSDFKSSSDDSEVEDLLKPYEVNIQHCLYTIHHEVYNNWIAVHASYVDMYARRAV